MAEIACIKAYTISFASMSGVISFGAEIDVRGQLSRDRLFIGESSAAEDQGKIRRSPTFIISLQTPSQRTVRSKNVSELELPTTSCCVASSL